MAQVRRLGPGDEDVLRLLAERDPEFDIADRHAEPERLDPLTDTQARAYLADPTVLFWVAEEGADVVGFLSCNVMPYRAQPARELLLYEIGVHRDRRRRGIGRSLVARMTDWMDANGIGEVWLGADNAGAEQFYLACGFELDDPATYMILRRPTAR
ncbi:MAG: hypothetical protein QOF57_981 [Frankiaceae bacterium]|jgi:ribosomal protein S18 acetylase RimI-like enzyme|nr:hypothetical protein [Frankiaceae bacterium]